MVQNDGELDLRLLELMGASTKDGENTIGMFGTGWKYGLALALRRKMKVIVFSGEQKIEFSKMPEHIRGTLFHRVAFSINGKRRRKTSMTTLLGESDWHDEWMFVREVVANAFDEGGFRLQRVSVDQTEPVGVPGTTRVYMSVKPRIREILDNMEHYIRRHGALESNDHGKLFAPIGKKCRIYKRGIFVKELDQPSLYDYDLTDLKLTESRSADSWDIKREIRETLTAASVSVRRNVLSEVEKAKAEDRLLFESDVDFYDWDREAQKAWSEAFTEEFGEEAVLCEGSQTVVESIKGLGKRAVTLPEKVAQVLRKGKKVLTERVVVGNGAVEGFIYRDPTTYEAEVIAKSVEVMGFLFGPNIRQIPVRIFKAEGEHRETPAKTLTETDSSVSLLLNESEFSGGARPVVELMYKEFLYLAGQYSTAGEALRNSAQKALIEEVLPKTGVVL
jgi:hypothetical protein